MIVVGLTGAIATGKSTASRMLKQMGIMVFDSDAFVHRIMNNQIVIDEIKEAFPSCILNNKISRPELGAIVFKDKSQLKILENIIHPKVKNEIKRLIRNNAKKQTKIMVLDIPLLFEGGWEKYCDIVINIYCDKKTQETRALQRNNMDKQKLKSILSSQAGEDERFAKADFIISSEYGLEYTKFELILALNELLDCEK